MSTSSPSRSPLAASFSRGPAFTQAQARGDTQAFKASKETTKMALSIIDPKWPSSQSELFYCIPKDILANIFCCLPLPNISFFIRSCKSARVIGLDVKVWRSVSKRYIEMPQWRVNSYDLVKEETAHKPEKRAIMTCLHLSMHCALPESERRSYANLLKEVELRKDLLALNPFPFVAWGLLRCVEIILTSKRIHQKIRSDALQIATATQKFEVAMMILRSGQISLNGRGISLLYTIQVGFSNESSLEFIRALLTSGPITLKDRSKAIKHAQTRGFREIVDLLTIKPYYQVYRQSSELYCNLRIEHFNMTYV